MTERSNRKRWFVVAGAAVFALAGAGFGSRYLPTIWARAEVPTFEVQSVAFHREVKAEGYLKAVKATPLIAPPEAPRGLKIAWLAPDGSRLKKGAMVVRFDASEFTKTLLDSQSDKKTAETRIAKERTQVGAALRDRDRTLAMSELELEQTRQFQSKDAEIFSRNQIIESQIDETLSQARMNHAGTTRGIEHRLSRSKLELLDIEKQRAQLAVNQAQKALESLEIRAPHDGVVVFHSDWRGNQIRVGDSVWPGQPIAELPLLDEMEAQVHVLEADASGLQVGREGTVTIEAHPDTRLSALIKQVDTLAKPIRRGVPTQYFGVTLKLARTDVERMKPGQRVTATLLLQEKQAIVVPRQAVFDRDGEPTVYIKKGPRFVAATVKLGESSPGRVIVESGLALGDRIALRDPTRGVDQLLENSEAGTSEPGSPAGQGQ